MLQPKSATYLDCNATYPIPERVRQQTTELLAQSLGNPSSIHLAGRRARALIENSRDSVAKSIGTRASERILLTSSGTEANQQVIRSCLTPTSHWITTAIEHSSLLAMREWHEARGGRVTVIGVSPSGSWRVADILSAVGSATTLVSVGMVNSEIGTIQPYDELQGQLKAHSPQVALHLDAAQAWGKTQIDVSRYVDSKVALTAAGHKVGGLAGAAWVWTSRGMRLEALIHSSQERGLRGGTENLIGIASMGFAASLINPADFAQKTRAARDTLEHALKSEFDVLVHGQEEERVTNTSNFFVPGRPSGSMSLVAALDLEGFCVSSGSACSSGVNRPSHVLLAMGYPEAHALSSVRVSISTETTEESLRAFVAALGRVRLPNR